MAARSHSLLVYYDGDCNLCHAAAENWRKLDWFQRVHFVSFRALDPAELPAPLSELDSQMHAVRAADGVKFVGIAAVQAVFARIPVYMPLAPLVWLFRRVGLGQPAYMFIAKRRMRWFGRRAPHCARCRDTH